LCVIYNIAGATVDDLVDKKAEKANLPGVDSLDCWNMIAGTGPQLRNGSKSLQSTTGVCRSEIPISDTSSIKPNGDGNTLVGGIIRNDGYKILLGAENKQFLVGQDVLTAPLWPNTTLPPLVPELHPKVCGRTPLTGCLFDILNDPSESDNLAARMPALFHEMLERIDALQVEFRFSVLPVCMLILAND
jgi:hypothetical protein